MISLFRGARRGVVGSAPWRSFVEGVRVKRRLEGVDAGARTGATTGGIHFQVALRGIHSQVALHTAALFLREERQIAHRNGFIQTSLLAYVIDMSIY